MSGDIVQVCSQFNLLRNCLDQSTGALDFLLWPSDLRLGCLSRTQAGQELNIYPLNVVDIVQYEKSIFKSVEQVGLGSGCYCWCAAVTQLPEQLSVYSWGWHIALCLTPAV